MRAECRKRARSVVYSFFTGPCTKCNYHHCYYNFQVNMVIYVKRIVFLFDKITKRCPTLQRRLPRGVLAPTRISVKQGINYGFFFRQKFALRRQWLCAPRPGRPQSSFINDLAHNVIHVRLYYLDILAGWKFVSIPKRMCALFASVHNICNTQA